MYDIMILRLITVFSIMLVFVGMYVFASTVRSTGRPFFSITAGVSALLTYVFAQLNLGRLIEYDDSEGTGWGVPRFYSELSEGKVFLILLAISVIFAVLIYEVRVYRNRFITPGAVKLGLDELPDGLLYYSADGIIRFINPAMSNIAQIVTDRVVLNGNDLYEKLCDGDLTAGSVRIASGEAIVIRLESGRIFSFERKEKLLKGRPISELICFDVTDEYTLCDKLRENHTKLAEQKERLLTLGDSITEFTIDKEILDAKVRIHDELGKGLTASRYYIEQKKGEPGELLKLWNTNLRLLSNEEKPKKRDDYETVLKASGDVGVGIRLKGSLPREDDNKKIIAAAIRECVTNTFRHAKGDTVYIETIDEDTEYRVTFRNNGMPPESAISETGGLKNLRSLVERAGGSMKIGYDPEFELMISLFKRGKEDVR